MKESGHKKTICWLLDRRIPSDGDGKDDRRDGVDAETADRLCFCSKDKRYHLQNEIY